MNQAILESALSRTAAPARGAAPARSAALVTAGLTFVTPSATKPRFESSALTGGAPRIHFETERHLVEIHDMRPLASTFTLDREGFELRRHATAVADLYDDEAIATRYYPEIESLLRATFGATRVIIFDATRRSDTGGGAQNRDGLRGPASRVHVDYTEKSGPQRLKDLLGETEAAALVASRARIIQINVWRPIRGPVLRSPLALADAESIRPADLIATDQVFPDRIGEIYHLAYHPSQRWYYAPEMTPDEVILIKGWDSLADGRARFTPHGAFDLADTLETAPPRESIEVRTMVVIDA